LTAETGERQYDILLRDLVHARKLVAYAVLPFATTVSSHGLRSSVQQERNAQAAQPDDTGVTDLLSIALRNLAWADCAPGEVCALLRQRVPPGFAGDEERALAAILSACLSKRFVMK
jgi:hypothetical protein